MGDFARGAAVPLFHPLMLLLDCSAGSAAFANITHAFAFYMECVSLCSSHFVPMC